MTQPPSEATPALSNDPKPKGGMGRTIAIASVALVIGFGLGSATGSDTPPDHTTATTVAGAPSTTGAAAPTTAVAPTTTVAPTIVPRQASDFAPNIVVIESTCFGSAGANVKFEIEWGWPGEAHGTLTYEISGLDDGAVDTASTRIEGTQYQVREHFVGIPGCDPEAIVVTPSLFRAD